MSFSWVVAALSSCVLIANTLAGRDENSAFLSIDVDQDGGRVLHDTIKHHSGVETDMEVGMKAWSLHNASTFTDTQFPKDPPVWCNEPQITDKAFWFAQLKQEFHADADAPWSNLFKSPAMTCCFLDEDKEQDHRFKAYFALQKGLEIVESHYKIQLEDWCPNTKDIKWQPEKAKYANAMTLAAGVEILADVCPMYKKLCQATREKKGKAFSVEDPWKYINLYDWFNRAVDIQKCSALSGVEKLSDEALLKEAKSIGLNFAVGGAVNVVGGAGLAAAALAVAVGGFTVIAVGEESREDALKSFVTNMAVAGVGIFAPGAAGQLIGGGTALDLAMVGKDLVEVANQKPQMGCKTVSDEALAVSFAKDCKSYAEKFMNFYPQCTTEIAENPKQFGGEKSYCNGY